MDPIRPSSLGERSLTVDYYWSSNGSLGKHERRPMIVAWTTLPRQVGRPAAFHRHLLATENAAKPHGARVEVSFPYAIGRKWSRDVCLHFLLMTQIQSSEGKWTYAKSASTEVYLADLVANPGAQKAPLRIQSYYMPILGHNSPLEVEAERHKGDLYVKLVNIQILSSSSSSSSSSSRNKNKNKNKNKLQWSKPSNLDLTPKNAPALQAAMMLAVTRSMSLFESTVVGGALLPTVPEIHNVHAPFYVQETPVGMDGKEFWTSVPDVARHHVNHHGGTGEAERYLSVLLRQSLARHNMTRGCFIKTAHHFDTHARSSSSSSSSVGRVTVDQIHRAVAVLATACTMRVNMMRYVSDKAILAKSKRSVVVESFDQVDIRTADSRDSGGVHSHDLMTVGGTATRGRSHHGRRNVVGSSVNREGGDTRDLAPGGAEDCEDGGRDAAVHFALFSDSGAGLPTERLSSKLVIAARKVARHYRAVGVLSSVLSRNLNDAQQRQQQSGEADSIDDDDDDDDDDNDTPDIGSHADLRVEVGAHMFTLLVPQRVLRKNVIRALSAKRVTSARVNLGDIDPETGRLTVPRYSPLPLGQELPVALCEGTGMLHPLMAPKEFYMKSVKDKLAVAISVVTEQEAQVRLRTGHTSEEIATEALQAGPSQTTLRTVSVLPSALDQFVPMHQQDRLIDNPNKRVVATFYRTASEMYVVPTWAQLSHRRTTNTPVRPDQLTGDRLVPVQIGDRSLSSSSSSYTWGLAVSDILRQQSFVGFLPTPQPSKHETMIVDRINSHVAPSVALHLDEHLGSDQYVSSAMGWARQTVKDPQVTLIGEALKQLERKMQSREAMRHRYVLVHGYAHPRDLTNRNMQELHRWLRDDNPHVVAFSFKVERSTYKLANLRLDALIDCGDTVEQVQPRIYRALMIKSRQNAIRSASSLQLVASASALALTTTTTKSKEGERRIERASREYNIGSRGVIRRHKISDRPLPKGFRGIMLQHIQLTIDYVRASWENRFRREVLPLDHPTITALFSHFDKWAHRIDWMVPIEARHRYNAIWGRIATKDYGGHTPSPGTLWKDQLILNHTVYTKNLSDAAWHANTNSQQRAKKAKALADITGLNNQRIIMFWISLLSPIKSNSSSSSSGNSNDNSNSSDNDLGKRITYLWDQYLVCTAQYIDSLASTDSLAYDSEFQKEAHRCLVLGDKFGNFLDAVFYRNRKSY